MEQLYSDPVLVDIEKEKLKEKIKEIIDFPVFYLDKTKEFDPRKAAEMPGWFPGIITPLSRNNFAEMLLVVIGERHAHTFNCFFKDTDKKEEFLNLIRETGIEVEIEGEKETDGGIDVDLLFSRTVEDMEKMKVVLVKGLNGNRKEFNRGIGELLGTPKTAIDAFMGESERASDQKEYDQKIPKNERGFAPFIYSKEHVEEEHQYRLNRNEKLKEYAPQLFE